jgi:valyl-tRNA synthetase
MTEAAGQYAGLDRFEARKRIVAALEGSGELAKAEPYTVNISKCDRSKTIIEPLISKQWFVRMKPLAAKAMEAVRSGRIRFVPDDREAVFFQWMENIRDWCISRQLWWGHRIPAWHCRKCGDITVERTPPAICPRCHSTEVEQDSDVLDTWFSSGLWPFSTLGWPDKTEDLEKFYPTSLLITGFDILFFWVSRMMMLGIECTGDVPFREVHMHGLVRDAEKQKMSKTKGNVVDPLEIMDRFGTDACRVGLLISAATGADIALKEDRLSSARSFANKIWNASRLLFQNMERSRVSGWQPSEADRKLTSTAIEDIWIVERFNDTLGIVNRALQVHRYHEVAQALWDFVWKDFCDWYLEIKKWRFEEGSGLDAHWETALAVYEATLRLCHPVMPFLTEELWQRLVHAAVPNSAQPVSISLAAYPAPLQFEQRAGALESFAVLQKVVTAARELRADNKLDPKASLGATLVLRTTEFSDMDLGIIASLSKLNLNGGEPGTGITRSTPEFDLHLHAVAPASDTRARLVKEIARIEKAVESTTRQLEDETFVSRAPAKVVESMRGKLAEYLEQLKRNRELLDGLDQ